MPKNLFWRLKFKDLWASNSFWAAMGIIMAGFLASAGVWWTVLIGWAVLVISFLQARFFEGKTPKVKWAGNLGLAAVSLLFVLSVTYCVPKPKSEVESVLDRYMSQLVDRVTRPEPTPLPQPSATLTIAVPSPTIKQSMRPAFGDPFMEMVNVSFLPGVDQRSPIRPNWTNTVVVTTKNSGQTPANNVKTFTRWMLLPLKDGSEEKVFSKIESEVRSGRLKWDVVGMGRDETLNFDVRLELDVPDLRYEINDKELEELYIGLKAAYLGVRIDYGDSSSYEKCLFLARDRARGGALRWFTCDTHQKSF